ncbi:MAG TPA: RNA polymerase sigma factor [Castellaniella sp.]|uniref:RNA polymerase sigma factor n=1 Tax=Castellaniella sp. TaxID=1955812 RepID=UPI002EFC61DE
MVEAANGVVASDDISLFQEAIAGDINAFDQIMRRYNQRMYRAARGILHDEMEAEDAVQEAWWKAYNHLGDFRSEALPSTWLTRIAVNEALMRLRRNKTREAVIQLIDPDFQVPESMSASDTSSILPPPEQPDQLTWRAELRALVEEQIDALPDLYREVFLLRGVEGMSSPEVAVALDMPEATVRVRYMRARRLLQSGLRGPLDECVRDAFSFAGDRCDRIIAGVHARMQAARAREA